MSYKYLHRKTLIAFHKSISVQPYAFKTTAINVIFYHVTEHRLYHVIHETWMGVECMSHALRHPLMSSPITLLQPNTQMCPI